MSWRVRLTRSALDDFDAIVDWTLNRFGATQASRYSELIASAIESLGIGPVFQGCAAGLSTAPKCMRCR